MKANDIRVITNKDNYISELVEAIDLSKKDKSLKKTIDRIKYYIEKPVSEPTPDRMKTAELFSLLCIGHAIKNNTKRVL